MNPHSTRRLLALDLGARRAGWAYFVGAELLSLGACELDTRRTESPGFRWIRFRAFLDSILDVSRLRVDLVAYEEVRNHVSRGKGGRPSFNISAAHAYGAAEGVLLAWADARALPYSSVTVHAVKAAATGIGGGKGTDKEAVLDAARRRWPRHFAALGQREPPYDEADAAMIGLAMLISLGVVEQTPAPPKPPKPPKERKPRPRKSTAQKGLHDAET